MNYDGWQKKTEKKMMLPTYFINTNADKSRPHWKEFLMMEGKIITHSSTSRENDYAREIEIASLQKTLCHCDKWQIFYVYIVVKTLWASLIPHIVGYGLWSIARQGLWEFYSITLWYSELVIYASKDASLDSNMSFVFLTLTVSYGWSEQPGKTDWMFLNKAWEMLHFCLMVWTA